MCAFLVGIIAFAVPVRAGPVDTGISALFRAIGIFLVALP